MCCLVVHDSRNGDREENKGRSGYTLKKDNNKDALHAMAVAEVNHIDVVQSAYSSVM